MYSEHILTDVVRFNMLRADDISVKLLRTFGFDDAEIEAGLDDWKDGCQRFGINDEDVRFAVEEYIPEYWDLTLRGVRLCIGAYLREVIEMFRMRKYLERGDKVIYCNMPVHPACVYANKVAGGDHLHISQPDFLIASILDPLFNRSFSTRLEPVSCMNGDCMHCEMNRYRIEAQMSGMLPSPNVTWNWGLICNEGPKSEEYLAIMDNNHEWNYVLTSLPHDTILGSKESENDHRAEYLAEHFRQSQAELSEYTGVTVGNDHVREALDMYIQYISKIEELTDLVCGTDPQPISCNDFTLFCALQHTAFNSGMSHFDKALDVLLDEVHDRVGQGYGVLPAGSPKVACHFTPYCIPWLEKIFRDNGINLSYSLYFAPASEQKKYQGDDVYLTIARQWLTNPSTVNMGDEVALVTSMLEKHPVDGVLYGFFSFDRWIGSIQKTMVRIIEERTGIHHYYLEGNFWNDARYTRGERLSRIENICYHIKINKLMS